jgi:hypothetical protein
LATKEEVMTHHKLHFRVGTDEMTWISCHLGTGIMVLWLTGFGTSTRGKVKVIEIRKV